MTTPAHDPALPDPAGLVDRVLARVTEAARGLDFGSYFLGVRARRLGKRVPEAALEAWKADVRRRVGTAVGLLWEPLGRRVVPVRPDLLLVWDADADRVEPLIRPLFLYGRYVKEARDVTQTRATWPCPTCRGARGQPVDPARRAACAACRGTGRLYPDSVEALVAGPAAAAFDADPARAQLHGMGREDVDVRCLVQGRPFVLEVDAPRRRHADLVEVAAEVERASGRRVRLPVGLRLVDGALVARVKGWPGAKRYRVVVEAGAALDAAVVAAAVARLEGATLEQRTPLRVARRRADLVRRRTVRAACLTDHQGARVVLQVEADPGTYIKELVSGDEGRTTPSFAGLVGVPCRCAELDVLAVRADDAAILGDDPPPAGEAADAAEGDAE